MPIVRSVDSVHIEYTIPSENIRYQNMYSKSS